MLRLLGSKLLEVLKAIAPLVAAVCVLQFAWIDAPAALFARFLGGAALAIVGMLLLLAGIEDGVLPMGRFIGSELSRRGSLPAILAVGFALGFVTTIAEPDVLVLSGQVESVSSEALSGRLLTFLIAGGVAIFAALALLRVVWGVSMRALLSGVYALMIVLSFLAPAEFVPLAYDAGSVTTGVLSAPVLLALVLGLASVLAGRSSASDGFGMLGLASAGPVIVVLLAGMLSS